jgi:hypothetical protein
MKKTALPVLAILVLSMFGGLAVMVPSVPHARAASNYIQSVAHCGAAGTECSVIIPVTVGETVIAGADSNACAPVGFSFSDNQSNTYEGGASGFAECGNYWVEAAITATTSRDNGHLEITVNGHDCDDSSCSILMVVWGVDGIPAQNLNFSSNFCSYTSSLNEWSPTGCNDWSQPVDLMLGHGYSGPLLIGVGALAGSAGESGFKSITGPDGGLAIYNDTGAVSTPTEFPMNTDAQFVIVGLSGAPTVIVTQVVPCNFFQLQCWLYPLFYLGMFEAFFIGVASAFRVSDKAFLYLVLSGATFASLIEIQMGIMTPALPVMLVLVNVAYSFRIDKVIFSGRGSPSE